MSDIKYASQLASCIIACGLALSKGIAFGWTSPSEEEIIDGGFGFPISRSEFFWIASMLPLGGLVASIPSGFLIDLLGRQFSLVLCVIPQALGWLLIRIASNIWVLYAGRFVLGMVGGLLYIAIPLYICEIADKEHRGLLGMLFQLSTYAGILFAYTLCTFTDLLSSTMVSMVVPLMLSAFVMHIPESPVFLLQRGREDEAKKMLKRLRGSQYDMTSELTTMRDDYNSWIQGRKTYYENIKSRACRKAIFITSGLICFQQLGGLAPIMFFTTGIFEAAKIGIDTHYATILVGVVQFLTNLIVITFADKWGRRFWLLFSSAFVILSHFALSLYFYFILREKKNVEDFYWLPVVSICCFVGMFAFGYGSIPWILIGELFPPGIKGIASSVPITLFWLLSFLTSILYFSVQKYFGLDLAFLLFSIFSLFGFLFVYFFVPETRGKTLNEIVQLLEGQPK